jgi:hypothetical protein
MSLLLFGAVVIGVPLLVGSLELSRRSTVGRRMERSIGGLRSVPNRPRTGAAVSARIPTRSFSAPRAGLDAHQAGRKPDVVPAARRAS